MGKCSLFPLGKFLDKDSLCVMKTGFNVKYLQFDTKTLNLNPNPVVEKYNFELEFFELHAILYFILSYFFFLLCILKANIVLAYHVSSKLMEVL